MSSTQFTVKPGTFGNISKPGRSGILGLPMGVSLTGVPFILVIVLMLSRQWFLPALAVAVVGVSGAVLVLVTKKNGRTIYGRTMLRFMQKRKEKSGRYAYMAGPTGRTRDGACRLPGLMAPSELREFTDSYGNPFGLIRVGATRHYSVVIEAHPDGDELVDGERVNSMVAHWGAWLAQRGIEEGIAGASVTIESAPDTGLRLQRMVRENMSPDSSRFGTQVAAAIPEEYSGGSPILTTRLTVTFDGRTVDGSGKDRGVEEMADEIGNRLPVILAGLYDTGAGTTVRAATAQDIIDATRTAYDPTTARLIEEARAEGGTGLRWEDAGPSFHLDGFELYRHDRAWSKSWTMYEGPRGIFYATSLRRVLEPTSDVLRKRVTLLYRPIPAARASELVERDINDATFEASQRQRVSARARQRRAAAEKSAQEEAEGAGLVRFGLVITVSVDDPEKFKRLDQAIPALPNQARLRMRPALGNQAVTFQAGLPLGLVLPEHMVLPDEVRDWL